MFYATMYVCNNEVFVFFQYRCLQWISSWEWMHYLIVQITSLQTYHYEQVGTLTIWWCYCLADSSCLFSFEKFFSEPFFVYQLVCHNSRLQSCQLDFFITSFCISFFPSWSFQQWAKSDFLVACTETESCSSFPGETRTVTKGLWVTWFYKITLLRLFFEICTFSELHVSVAGLQTATCASFPFECCCICCSSS